MVEIMIVRSNSSSGVTALAAAGDCYRQSASSTSAKSWPAMAFGGYAFADTGRRSAQVAKAADAAMASGIARTIKQRTTGSIQTILIALVIRDNTQSRGKNARPSAYTAPRSARL